MAKYTIIKLQHLTPLHLGTGKENYDFSADYLQSDTISAALSAIRAQIGKTADVESFMNSFTISSAFPYIDNHYFLPKMQGKINVVFEENKDDENRKELKKIKYIELPLWQQLMSGEQVVVKKNQLQQKYMLSGTTKFQNPALSQVMQRVSIPRGNGQDAEPFYFDWTYFRQQGGLYFLVDAQAETLNEILQLFIILGETGIGSDKNVGGGMFDVISETIEIKQVAKPNASMILSLYIPTKDEMNIIKLPNSRYQLLHRGGFMAGSLEEDFRHLRKKSIYMLGVGSVFPTTEPLKGKVVNLIPDWNDKRIHPVFRSGKVFYFPVTI